MFKNFIRILSLVLVVSLLWNMLPLSVLGAELRASQALDGSLTASDSVSTEKMQETDAITVLGEITERRTENIKEYLLSNGNTLAAVYGDSVHYQENGEWKDIDNTLIVKNGTYVNTAGAWDVSFPQTLSGNNRISITKDGYTLSFGMAGKLTLGSGTVVAKAGENVLYATETGTVPTITVSAANTSQAQLQQLDFAQAKAEAQHPELVREKLTSRLSYNQVYANTDVVYDLDGNRVKESVILSRYDSTLRGYRYTLQTGDMIPVLAEDGHIDFYDARGEEIILTMPAPFLVDANLEYNWDVQVDLSGSGSTYTLTYTLPRQWLAEESRAWPVVLDPVVNVSDSDKYTADQTVFSNGSKSYTWGILQCGYSTTLGISRAYLKFTQIPTLNSGDVIVNAKVSLTKAVTSSRAFYVAVHSVDSTWSSSGITWANKPDFNTNAADYVAVKTATRYTWDVTDIARGWYETGINTGMMFKASPSVENYSTSNHWSQFYSSDYGAYKPGMTLEYRNTSGLENYWDYTSASAGRAGTAYVNANAGNLVFVRNLMGFGGNRMPVSIDLVYNASDKDYIGSGTNCVVDFGLGYGWRTNYHQRVYAEGSNYYIWEDADGTRHYFKKNTGDGIYYDEDNLDLKLTVSGSTKTIEDLAGNTSTFDASGRLTTLTNNQATQSSINITYSSGNLISQITDGVNRVYTFAYTNGVLTRVSYKASGTSELHSVTLAYTNGNLTGITDRDNASCTYTYSNNLLMTASDPHGVGLTFAYLSTVPNRVIKVAEHSGSTLGNHIEFSYGNKWTRMEDNQKNVQYMLFNAHGNTISIQNDKGGAVFAKYATEEKADAKKNQLTISSDLWKTVINLYDDGNFENSPTVTVAGTAQSGIVSGGYIGEKAFQIAPSTAAASARFLTLSVAPGESYTLTAYMNVSSGSARLRFTNGSAVYAESVYATEADHNQWVRFEVSYTNTTGQTQTVYAEALADASSSVKIDCVQIEKTVSGDKYNLIANSDFTVAKSSANYKWTESDLDSGDGRKTLDSAAPGMDGNAMKITGYFKSARQVSQTVNVSGQAGDVYTLAGWLNGYVPEEMATYYGQRRLGLDLTFYNSGGTIIGETYHLPFSPHMDSWQYAAGQAKAEADYAYIVVTLVCDYHVNTVYFDGIQLHRGGLGNDYDYNDDGDVTKVTNAQGQITTYSYDGRDLTGITNHDGSTVSYVYDSYKNITKETVTYPAAGVGEEPIQHVTDYVYDTYGNVLTTTVLADATYVTSATYTSNGNYPATVTDEKGNVTTYNYNLNTGVLNSVQSPGGSTVSYTYDTMYRPAASSQNASAGTMSVAYNYSGDRLATVTTGSTVYTLSYGDFGATQYIKAGNYTLATYEYDGYRNLSCLTYGEDSNNTNNARVEYSYDAQGRVTVEQYTNDTDTKTVTYTYDEEGKLTAVNDGISGKITAYYYDALDRLTLKEIRASGVLSLAVRYQYDEEDQLIGKTIFSDGQTPVHTAYAYDHLHNLSQITGEDVFQKISYSSHGLLEQTTTGYTSGGADHTVKQETYVYGTADTALHQHTVTYGGKTNTDTYTYDGRGNITQITRKVGSTEYIIKYTYDAANQLIREDNQQAGYTWVMTYDDAGNMLTRKKYSYTTGTLGSVLSTQTLTYGNATWGDLLTGINGTTVTSDAIGNILNDGTWTYTWKNGRQLATMSKSGVTWSFAYDASGMRTQRVSGSTTYNYTYDDSTLVRMTVGNNTLIFTYGASGHPMSVNFNGVDYYYVTNALGDVLAIVNSVGTEVVTYAYDAWGNILSTGGTMTSTLGTHNPLRYRGYVYDQETGLYYLQSRYYNPLFCRFISADTYVSTGQGILGYNMFAYCLNNPVNYTDASGETGIMAAGWLVPLLALVDALTPFLEIVAICLVGVTVINEYKEREQSKSIAISDTLVSKDDQQAVYYGADIVGDSTGKKEWRIRTGPMDYETAISWTYATAASGIYGKNASWGLYTPNQNDASDIAVALGGVGPCLHENRINEYPHFHVLGMLFLGKYKHFHVWYGSMYEE